MKHFVLLAVLCIASYLVWALASRGEKGRIRRHVRKHMRPIVAIVLVLLAGLVGAFYTRSINLL